MKFGGGYGYGSLLDSLNDSLDDMVPTEVEKRLVFVPHRRSRINLLGACVNVIAPWLFFTLIYWAICFDFHVHFPTLLWCLVLTAWCLFPLVFAIIAYLRLRTDADPSWHVYAAGAFFLAGALAIICGQRVFCDYYIHYSDYAQMGNYVAVDPVKYKGEMVMDAGSVYFSTGSHIDTKRSMAFKHVDTYCVAPISRDVGFEIQSYDMWAIGKNCCTNPHYFHCGDWKNLRARSALRNVVDIDDNVYYRLAVQQAEAAYGITARNPVFFEWMQDPVDHLDQLYLRPSVKYFYMGSFTYFVFNLFCTATAVMAFARISGAV